MIPNVLTIAGSDPSGGAGIQADLKTFSALGCYGMSVLTSLTAQNTQGVSAIQALPVHFVEAQCDSLFSDIRVDSVKIGMLAQADVAESVSQILRKHRPEVVVLDTVMVAKGGHRLLTEAAVEVMRRQLLPLADLVTPNLPEAAALLEVPEAHSEQDMRAQGQALLRLGSRAVLMKGGHLLGDACPDWLITPSEEVRFSQVRVDTKNTHGTGCSLSAAVAALRPQCATWSEAVERAKAWLTAALQQSSRLQVGHGIGPIHHFHRWF